MSINTKPVSSHHNGLPFKIAMAAVFLIFVAVGVVLIANKTRKEKDTGIAVSTQEGKKGMRPSPTPTLIPYPVKGRIHMKETNGLTRVPMGKTAAIAVFATSENQDIVGFDLVVSYDAAAFDFVKVVSKLDTFKAYAYQRKGYVSISTAKSLQDTTKTVFSNTRLALVIFEPKKKGTYTFSLDPVGNETTKFADSKANMSYPSVGKLTLEIY